MNRHKFNPQGHVCYGCDATAADVADGKTSGECPATYQPIGDKGANAVIGPTGKLTIFAGPVGDASAIALSPEETIDLADAIEAARGG